MKTLAVNFKNDTIDIVKEEKLLTVATKDSGVVKNQELWVSVTKVCTNLGMTKSQAQTQKEKIRKDDSYFCKEFPVLTSKGDREALCIPLSKLNGWLFSISHNKVRGDIREKLVEYKNECFEVLNDHFMKPKKFEPYLIGNKDPRAIIRGLKSQLVQHIKKIELQNTTIDGLIAENATLALPAPAVNVEPYKEEIKRQHENINYLTQNRDHFSEMAGNMALKVNKLKHVPKLLKAELGKYLDFPEVYNMLDSLALQLERDIKGRV